MSSETRELDLCGKVEMRIALSEDDKLESILKTYLAPLLLKLASEHASVRNKVRSATTILILSFSLMALTGYIDLPTY